MEEGSSAKSSLLLHDHQYGLEKAMGHVKRTCALEIHVPNFKAFSQVLPIFCKIVLFGCSVAN